MNLNLEGRAIQRSPQDNGWLMWGYSPVTDPLRISDIMVSSEGSLRDLAKPLIDTMTQHKVPDPEAAALDMARVIIDHQERLQKEAEARLPQGRVAKCLGIPVPEAHVVLAHLEPEKQDWQWRQDFADALESLPSLED